MLVPLLPVDTAVLLIGAVLVAIGLGLAAASPLVSLAAVAGIALVAVALGALTVNSDSPCLRQSKYHCLSLVADRERPDSFELLLDDAYNSYADASDPTYLDYG